MNTSKPMRKGCVLAAFLTATTMISNITAVRRVSTQKNSTFNFIFVSDLEEFYRGHRRQDIQDVCDEIIDLNQGRRKEFFLDRSHVRVWPSLVIHGGDAYDNTDGGGQARRENNIAKWMMRNDIPYITTDGNHDMNSGKFVSDTLKYTGQKYGMQWGIVNNRHYWAKWNDVQFAIFTWKGNGGRPTQSDVNSMKTKLDGKKPILIVNHAPSTDTDALNRWLGDLPPGSAAFHGHHHMYAANKIGTNQNVAYTAPYPHQWNDFKVKSGLPGDKRERQMLAVLWSFKYGALEVKRVDTRLRSRVLRKGHRCEGGYSCCGYEGGCWRCKDGFDYRQCSFGGGCHCN